MPSAAHTPSKIFVDTSLGEFGTTTTGKLLDSLHAADLQATDIDTALISHDHGGHITGIRNKAGELAFPQAKGRCSPPNTRSGWQMPAWLQRPLA